MAAAAFGNRQQPNIVVSAATEPRGSGSSSSSNTARGGSAARPVPRASKPVSARQGLWESNPEHATAGTRNFLAHESADSPSPTTPHTPPRGSPRLSVSVGGGGVGGAANPGARLTAGAAGGPNHSRQSSGVTRTSRTPSASPPGASPKNNVIYKKDASAAPVAYDLDGTTPSAVNAQGLPSVVPIDAHAVLARAGAPHHSNKKSIDVTEQVPHLKEFTNGPPGHDDDLPAGMARLTIPPSPAPIDGAAPTPRTAFASMKTTTTATQTTPRNDGSSLASLQKKLYPIDSAWWTSLLTLSFLGPILSLGYRRTLEEDDVPMLSADDATERVVDVFTQQWNKWAPPIRGSKGASGASGGGGGGDPSSGPTSATPSKPRSSTFSPLTRTLLGCYGWAWFIGAACTAIGRWSMIISPLMIREFLTWVQADSGASGTGDGFLFDWSDDSIGYGILVCAVLVFLMILSSVLVNHAYYQGVRIGCAYRTALMSLIFEKSLRCSTYAGGGAEKGKDGKPVAGGGGGGTGQTVNLMANDTQQIFDAATYIHFIYVDPILTLGTVAVLYWQIGPAALAAGGLMIILLPVQIAVARRIGRNRANMVRHTDSRVKILSEILQGIRVIKLYAWEIPMAERVQEVRIEELKCVKRALLLKSFNLLTLFLWPVVVSMVTFIVFVSLGNRLTVVDSITILAFVNVLSRPITVLPMALISVAEVRVSIARIEKYLLQDELQQVEKKDKDDTTGGDDGDSSSLGLVAALPAKNATPSPGAGSAVQMTAMTPSAISVRPGGGLLVTPSAAPRSAFGGVQPVIEVKDGSFAWERSAAPTLASINFTVRPGALIGVIGGVGSGKSSLLSAILGEMHPVEGRVRVQGRVGYMAQQPWIQNCTVRDNILFGLPFDQQKYDRTLAAACLTSDMATFKEGDQTEIGERGITMSGGQKARVSLARAVYREALCDVYLLDDPFAAVDVHVGTSMFFESVAGVLKDKTRVVVLNSHLHLLRHFDEIVVVETDTKSGNAAVGRIAARGSFAQMERLYPALLAQQQLRSQVAAAEATSGAPTAALVEIKEEEFSKGSDGTQSGRHGIGPGAGHRKHSSVGGGSGEFFVPSGEGVMKGDKRAKTAGTAPIAEDMAFVPSDVGTQQVSRDASRNPSVVATRKTPQQGPIAVPHTHSMPSSRRGSASGVSSPTSPDATSPATAAVVHDGQFQTPMEALALQHGGASVAMHGADEGDETEDMELFGELRSSPGMGGRTVGGAGNKQRTFLPGHHQTASQSFQSPGCTSPVPLSDQAAYTASMTAVGRYLRQDTATSGALSPTPVPVDERVNLQFLASGKKKKPSLGFVPGVGVADSSAAPSPSPSPKSPAPLLPPTADGKSADTAAAGGKGKKGSSLMSKEDRAVGSIGFNLYRYYFDMAAMSHVPDLVDIDDEEGGAGGAPTASPSPMSPPVIPPLNLPGTNSARASSTIADSEAGGRMLRQSTQQGAMNGTTTITGNGSSKSSTPSTIGRDDLLGGVSNGQVLLPGSKDVDSASPPAPTLTLPMPSPEAAAAESAPTAATMDLEAHQAIVSTTYSGLLILLGVVSLFIFCQALRIGCDLWLTYWGQEEADNAPDKLLERLNSGDTSLPANHGHLFWMVGCALFAGCTFLFVGVRAWLFVSLALRVSDRMHRSLFRKLLLAPITTFYDVTPLGRILNRFSKDFDQVDSFCPDLMAQLLQHTFNLLGGLALSISSTYWYVFVLVPIFWAFGKLQGYFRLSSRELKRLEGVTRSPIFSTFGETLLGLATIRAYRVQEAFIQKQRDFIQTNAKIYTSFYLTSRWLSLRLDFISNFLILAVGAFGLGLKGSLDTALIGLALNYTLQFTGFLQWTVRVSVDTENSFTAVERLSHYNNLPREAPYVVRAELAPPKGWPAKGDIVFNNLMMRYRPELPWILKGVSCRIKAREKVGICGRTGSGKSSLMVSLFRLVESPTANAIMIDGVDIGTVGLLTLRSAVSIIPQDPVLFSGTIRQNLDPFGSRSEAQLWTALGQVSLQAFVLSLPGGLDAHVAEYGENLSSGQRQLVCIARALLRQTKVIVLDEATAAVDNETDALIQTTLRTCFADCTVLTIAHRLNTIMDSDKVMVLDYGHLAEFDTPHNLLQKPGGIFANMVATADNSKKKSEAVASAAEEEAARG